jgi:hypothetical protein
MTGGEWTKINQQIANPEFPIQYRFRFLAIDNMGEGFVAIIAVRYR